MTAPVCPLCGSAQHVVEDPTTGRRCFTCAACGRAFVLPAAVTTPTIPAPAHEDDLRLALHEVRVAATLIEVALELQAHGQDHAREVTAAVERVYAAAQAFGGREAKAETARPAE